METHNFPTRAGVLSGLANPPNSPFQTDTVRTGAGADLMLGAYDLRSVLLGEPKEYEREVSDKIARQNPELRSAGLYVPYDVFSRDLTLTSGPGSDFVGTELPLTIADALRPYSVCVGNGATVLSGLRGNFQYPRFASTSSPTFMTEIQGLSDGSQSAGAMTLTAHRISTEVILSRAIANPGTCRP